MLLYLLKAFPLLLAAIGQPQRAKGSTGNTILVYRDFDSPGPQKNQSDNPMQLPTTNPTLVKRLDVEDIEKPYDIITEWKLPAPEKVEEKIEKFVDPLRRVHSPVFFSTDGKGKRWVGLSRIPVTESPLVIVGNHQFGT